MAHLKLISYFLACLFLILYKRVIGVCYDNYGTQPFPTIECNASPKDPVCLTCPVYQKSDVEWYIAKNRIAYGNFYVGEANNVTVNTCHDTNASLRFNSCGQERISSIQCQQAKKTLADFTVICKTEEFVFPERMIILGDRVYETKDGYLTVQQFSDISPRCIIQHVLLPVTIVWLVDDEIILEEEFLTYSNETTNVSLSLTNVSLSLTSNINTSITCVAFGQYMRNMTRAIFLIKDTVFEETDKTNITLNLTPSVYISVGVVISLALVGILAIALCLLGNRGSFRVSEGRTDNIEMEDNVCYLGLGDQSSSTVGLKYLVTDSNLPIVKPILKEKLLCSLPFEYWNAEIPVDGATNMTCLAKKLSEKATIGDYSNFKLLAESLSLLHMNERLVKIRHISIQTLPFGIFYEAMSCGTLYDHVMNHYRKRSRLSKTIRRQVSYFHRPVLKEFLNFAVNIAQAMQYLASHKFCHPALSLRKVLMTPQGSCKLYDVYPNNLCMERIKHLMKKKNPPTAWMATEIFLLDKYFLKSDSWNFSVFLWELLTIGKIPFASISEEGIKEKVLDSFMLSRPAICPNNMFQVMVSCWQKDHTLRPSCSDILQCIRSEYEKMHEKYQDCDYSEIPE